MVCAVLSGAIYTDIQIWGIKTESKEFKLTSNNHFLYKEIILKKSKRKMILQNQNDKNKCWIIGTKRYYPNFKEILNFHYFTRLANKLKECGSSPMKE